MASCKAEGCNTIVADPSQDFCRTCRAKLASEAQEMKAGRVAVETDPLDLPDLAGDDIEAYCDDMGLPPLSPLEGLRRRLRMNMHHGTENGVGAFILPKDRDLTRNYTLQIMPQRIFRAEGLMVWGVTDDSYIEQIHVGHQIVADVCGAPIPARFFATAQSWEEVEKQVKEHGISGPSWVTWPTCHLGNLVSITIRGPMANALVWGKVAF